MFLTGVLFQNFSKNTSQLFIRTLISNTPAYVNCRRLPTTTENVFSENYGCLRFIDFLGFYILVCVNYQIY